MGERFDVKAAAANDDSQLAPGVNFIDGAKRELSEFLRVHFFQDRHRPDQMMRHFGESGRVRFGGQKIETAINLKRVGADDFGADLARYIGGELGFSGGGRADDEKTFERLLSCERVEASLTV